MRYTPFAIGCLIAVGLLTLTACGTAADTQGTTTAVGVTAVDVTAVTSTSAPQTEQTSDVTLAGVTVTVPESFAFESVRFEGEGHTREALTSYLSEHHTELLETMHNHGISESEDLKILPIPIYALDLQTGTVNLDAHYLPTMEDGAMIGAARVSAREGLSVSARTAELSWMSAVDRCLKQHPEERYLLAECYTSEGTYFCLISSRNEIIYLRRPEGGEDLPFESGVDYFGTWFDGRLVISHDILYAVKKPIREIVVRFPPDILYVLSASRATDAEFAGEMLSLSDPPATAGVKVTRELPMNARRFEELCGVLSSGRLDRMPQVRVKDGEEQLAVKNGKVTLIVYFEDGSRRIVQTLPDSAEENAFFAALTIVFARKA